MKRAAPSSGPSIVCALCRRKFGSPEQLEKHEKFSDLHKQNLAAQGSQQSHETPKSADVVQPPPLETPKINLQAHAAPESRGLSVATNLVASAKADVTLHAKQVEEVVAIEVTGPIPEIRPHGIVKWYNARRHYGILSTPHGDLFLPGKEHFVLVGGDEVSYSVLEMDGKECAVDVRLAGTDRPKCILRAFETWDGHRDHNEDRYCFEEIKGLGLFAGIFDGHGGIFSAEYLQNKLHRHVGHCFKSKWSAARQAATSRAEEVQMITDALITGFNRTDEALLAHQRLNTANEDGSTACVCLIVPGLEPEKEDDDDYTGQTLFVANAGDCRCLLLRGKNSFRCSEDHKPDRKDEILRIRKAGGIVGKDANGVARVGRKETIGGEKKTYQYLSTSRGFGDPDLKSPQALVIPTPDVKVVELGYRDWGFVLACDGVWDVMTDQEVAEICTMNVNNPKSAASTVVRTAFAKGSTDNLSCAVLMLDWIAEKALTLPERKVDSGGANMDDMFAC
eukprot:GEMP01021363.1.p1 GENE.GEMP01021363.1~~GEMP01021363.1.p1  ORF type:complete len:507 (-),score=92.41 GEMP01021363.1:790-2310(-)